MSAATALLAKRWPVLIRREFWEHRSLWMGPLVIAALYLLLCLLPVGGRVHVERLALSVHFAQLIFSAVLNGLMSIVIFFYLTECLYEERRDRSILFWKSLPVSDSATVLTKLLVALLVVPLGLFVLALVTNLFASVILYLRLHDNATLAPFVAWNTGDWLRMNVALLLAIPIYAIWYAPIAAYQLLVSAWARSAVFVWTVLPPVLVILGERFAFGTWRVRDVLVARMGLSIIGVAQSGWTSVTGKRLFESFDAIVLLRSLDLWIGVAIAAALLFATIRIRRYRDDT